MFEECLYFNSNALARSVTKLWAEAYGKFDISPPHAFLLRVVLNKPGLFARDLADELKISRSTVTRFLDSLEKRDYLIRKVESPDGREVRVFPAKRAKKIHGELDKTGSMLSKKMADIFGKTELDEIVKNMRIIQNELGKLIQ